MKYVRGFWHFQHFGWVLRIIQFLGPKISIWKIWINAKWSINVVNLHGYILLLHAYNFESRFNFLCRLWSAIGSLMFKKSSVLALVHLLYIEHAFWKTKIEKFWSFHYLWSHYWVILGSLGSTKKVQKSTSTYRMILILRQLNSMGGTL